MVDIFRECRERVTAQDAARHYGLTFDRRGWAVCPFHQDKHPSMSFRAGRFRCWACNASGDAIDFTGRLLGLDALGAADRLNADFMLDLPLHRKATPAEEKAARRRQEVAQAHRAFEGWRSNFIVQLTTAYRAAHTALQKIEAPEDMDKLSPAEVMTVQWQAVFEFWADTLSYGEPKEQAAIYRERGRIAQWIGKALSNC